MRNPALEAADLLAAEDRVVLPHPVTKEELTEATAEALTPHSHVPQDKLQMEILILIRRNIRRNGPIKPPRLAPLY